MNRKRIHIGNLEGIPKNHLEEYVHTLAKTGKVIDICTKPNYAFVVIQF